MVKRDALAWAIAAVLRELVDQEAWSIVAGVTASDSVRL